MVERHLERYYCWRPPAEKQDLFKSNASVTSDADIFSSQTHLVLREGSVLCFVAQNQEVDYPTFLRALAECLVQVVQEQVVGLACE